MAVIVEIASGEQIGTGARGVVGQTERDIQNLVRRGLEGDLSGGRELRLIGIARDVGGQKYRDHLTRQEVIRRVERGDSAVHCDNPFLHTGEGARHHKGAAVHGDGFDGFTESDFNIGVSCNIKGVGGGRCRHESQRRHGCGEAAFTAVGGSTGVGRDQPEVIGLADGKTGQVDRDVRGVHAVVDSTRYVDLGRVDASTGSILEISGSGGVLRVHCTVQGDGGPGHVRGRTGCDQWGHGRSGEGEFRTKSLATKICPRGTEIVFRVRKQAGQGVGNIGGRRSCHRRRRGRHRVRIGAGTGQLVVEFGGGGRALGVDGPIERGATRGDGRRRRGGHRRCDRAEVDGEKVVGEVGGGEIGHPRTADVAHGEAGWRVTHVDGAHAAHTARAIAIEGVDVRTRNNQILVSITVQIVERYILRERVRSGRRDVREEEEWSGGARCRFVVPEHEDVAVIVVGHEKVQIAILIKVDSGHSTRRIKIACKSAEGAETACTAIHSQGDVVAVHVGGGDIPVAIAIHVKRKHTHRLGAYLPQVEPAEHTRSVVEHSTRHVVAGVDVLELGGKHQIQVAIAVQIRQTNKIRIETGGGRKTGPHGEGAVAVVQNRGDVVGQQVIGDHQVHKPIPVDVAEGATFHMQARTDAILGGRTIRSEAVVQADRHEL